MAPLLASLFVSFSILDCISRGMGSPSLFAAVLSSLTCGWAVIIHTSWSFTFLINLKKNSKSNQKMSSVKCHTIKLARGYKNCHNQNLTKPNLMSDLFFPWAYGPNIRKRLNGATVRMFKMHPRGTFPQFEIHQERNVPPFEMWPGGTVHP